MTPDEQAAIFNLKAVTRETGLKPDTLRAWERRYGLPNPKRTPGRHRLYSQRDIDTLKWLVARQNEGLSISRAVELWHRLEKNGHDPITAPEYALPTVQAAPVTLPGGGTLADYRASWLSACQGFDESQAEQVLAFALALYPPEVVCFEIMLKSLAEIGESWYLGQVTVQQEHFASELAMRRLEAMIAALPSPTRPARILVGCAPDDNHTFVPLLLTFLLRQRGWDVVYLGGRVPAEHLSETAEAVQPRLAILSAQQLGSAATLLSAAQALAQTKVPLAYGGRVFNRVPGLRARIPGHFLGERIEDVPSAVERLLTARTSPPDTTPVAKAYRQALDSYQANLPKLEADLWQRSKELGIAPAHLTLANQMLSGHIRAALTLGDMAYIGTDLEWIEGLLNHHGIPHKRLERYLDAYHQAAKTHLGKHGQPVVRWLATLNENG